MRPCLAHERLLTMVLICLLLPTCGFGGAGAPPKMVANSNTLSRNDFFFKATRSGGVRKLWEPRYPLTSRKARSNKAPVALAQFQSMNRNMAIDPSFSFALSSMSGGDDMPMPAQPAHCNSFINSVALPGGEYSFTTPNYPGNYTPSTDCYKIIHAPPNKTIVLNFRQKFQLEPHPNCKYDYLELRDGPYGFSPEIASGKFCSQERIPRTVHSEGRYMWLWFHSDKNLQKSGFKAVYTYRDVDKNEVLSAHDCRISVNLAKEDKREAVLSSSQFPVNPKQSHMDCAFEISVPYSEKIFLTYPWIKFDLFEKECEQAYLQIFDGFSHYATQLPESRICRKSKLQPFFSTTNRTIVRIVAPTPARFPNITILVTVGVTPSPKNPESCPSAEYFLCEDDHRCIHKTLLCNGHNNCPDKSDEKCTNGKWGLNSTQPTIADEDDKEKKKGTDYHIISLSIIGCLLLGLVCVCTTVSVRYRRKEKREMKARLEAERKASGVFHPDSGDEEDGVESCDDDDMGQMEVFQTEHNNHHINTITGPGIEITKELDGPVYNHQVGLPPITTLLRYNNRGEMIESSATTGLPSSGGGLPRNAPIQPPPKPNGAIVRAHSTVTPLPNSHHQHPPLRDQSSLPATQQQLQQIAGNRSTKSTGPNTPVLIRGAGSMPVPVTPNLVPTDGTAVRSARGPGITYVEASKIGQKLAEPLAASNRSSSRPQLHHSGSPLNKHQAIGKPQHANTLPPNQSAPNWNSQNYVPQKQPVLHANSVPLSGHPQQYSTQIPYPLPPNCTFRHPAPAGTLSHVYGPVHPQARRPPGPVGAPVPRTRSWGTGHPGFALNDGLRGSNSSEQIRWHYGAVAYTVDEHGRKILLDDPPEPPINQSEAGYLHHPGCGSMPNMHDTSSYDDADDSWRHDAESPQECSSPPSYPMATMDTTPSSHRSSQHSSKRHLMSRIAQYTSLDEGPSRSPYYEYEA